MVWGKKAGSLAVRAAGPAQRPQLAPSVFVRTGDGSIFVPVRTCEVDSQKPYDR